MADEDSIKWAEKSKQIEAEKMKAARALVSEKQDKTNLAFLDPKTTKVKGWSNDFDVVMASAERIGNRSLLFAVGGIVLDIIGMVGGMVTSAFQLGVAGAIIAGLPSGIGYFCIGIGVLMAMVTVGCEIVFKVKKGKKFTSVIWSAVATIGVITVYLIARWLIIRFS